MEAFKHLFRPEDLSAFQAETHSKSAYEVLLRDQQSRVWLAETSENDLLGYAVARPCTLPVSPMPDGALQLNRIYVSAAHQGRGIGALLMERFIEWVASKGDPPAFLSVYYDNIGAHRVYQRYGFRHIGEYDFHVGDHVNHEYIFRRG